MQGTGARYPMRLDPWLPTLILFGATPARSFVEVVRDSVRFRFGPLFTEEIPLHAIRDVRRTSWSLLGGIGWRLGWGARSA